MKARNIVITSALLGISCASGAAPAAPGAREPQTAVHAPMRRPGWLPPEAREMLMARMQRHGEEMMSLMVHVVVLGYDEAARQAGEIAAEPRLGRPAPGEQDTLNALLPARFFDLEDELRARAVAMQIAAKSRDNAQLVSAYGRLVETCVSCHAAYLDDGTSDNDLKE